MKLEEMKAIAVIMCISISVTYYAQEQNHLKGTEFENSPNSNSIQEIAEKRKIMELDVAVYPNPSQGNLFVEGESGSVVTVYSLEGTYVGTWEIGELRKVEITDLPQGSFICSINYLEQRTLKKFVVL
jgi:hypothetical protein